MKKWLASIWRGIVPPKERAQNRRKRRGAKLYRYLRVDEFPEKMEKHRLYVAGENGFIWAAAMLCPCGCGDVIELNLLSGVRPCWTVREDSNGYPSVMPSVWRRQGCGSHFILHRGRIEWYEKHR